MNGSSELDLLRQQLENAMARHRQGNLGEAAQICRAVLGQHPEQPDALHLLGIIAQQMGNASLALQLFDEAVRVAPHFSQAFANRATLLHAVERDEEALDSARHAIAIEPAQADAWNMVGLILRHRREYEESLAAHARAVALKPDNAGFHSNYAIVLSVLGRYVDAYQEAMCATQLDPKLVAGFVTLAEILVGMGYPERALDAYHEAQKIDPNYASAFVSEGRTALLMGDYERGWALVEKRALFTHDNKRLKDLPRWNGEWVEHLLLGSEQGAGDTLQFMRYIPMIKSRVGRITMQTPKALQRLMQFNFPDIDVVTPEAPLPAVDAFEPLLSLPYHCQTRLETIPANGPYIKADESWRMPWRERLSSVSSPRIGLVWAGNPFQLSDYARSLQFERVTPIVAVAHDHLVSLQKSPVQCDLSGTGIFDAAPFLDDFAATAGLMAELDLIITTCTSVAHLAGGLGCPVWLMATHAADWRWMLGREDSPWYPSMRLFRQMVARDWGTVIARVQHDLGLFLGGDRSVLTPKQWDGTVLRQHPHAIPLPV